MIQESISEVLANVNSSETRDGFISLVTHPAVSMPFDDLRAGLLAALDSKLVTRHLSGEGLETYCYSNSCVYDRQWSPVTLVARGLILDPVAKRVVALPFPKFFNVGENLSATVPDLPFETFEKLDGSLIILFWHKGEWRTATKGAFGSDQAKWAKEWLAAHDLSALDHGVTYLAEAIYPANRIVIAYGRSELVLLAAYRLDGVELRYDELCATGERLGWAVAKRHSFASVADLILHTKGLPPSEEGFVLRFENGVRLKVKGEEYRRIHALISRLSPLSIWEAMHAGDDLETIRRDLPEEFWRDFDAMKEILDHEVAAIVRATKVEADRVADLSDKDVGLQLSSFPTSVRSFIFPYRKNGDLLSGRTRQALFRAIRPTGNRLDGYVPSYLLSRVLDEAGLGR